jgi:predicted PurR-regulated permease PerM
MASDEQPQPATAEESGTSEPSSSAPAPSTPSTAPLLPTGAAVSLPAGAHRSYFARVPFATLIAAIGLVILTWAAIGLIGRSRQIITWLLISTFFAIVLTPVVDFVHTRFHLRRGLAAGLVFVLGLASLVGLGYLFIRPLADQATEFADKFPQYVEDARDGRGQIGRLVKRWEIDTWLEENQTELQQRAQDLFKPNEILGTTVDAIGSAFSVVAAVLTIAVLTILMLLEGRELMLSAIRVLRPDQQERVRRVSRDAARAITGYFAGNLAISAIAGVSTFVFLSIIGVPFAGVLALWVAFADLIPLVGATLGAIPAVFVAFLSSTGAGIAALIFYIVYQQFENHVLQVAIMSKTVALKPLVILVSVLVGVELAGVLGALLAIPIAGVIKVVGTDIVRHRRLVHDQTPQLRTDASP